MMCNFYSVTFTVSSFRNLKYFKQFSLLVMLEKEEIAKMRAERNILVKNMSCIFKTAREEIARKDAIIDDLRKKAFLSTGATPHQR